MKVAIVGASGHGKVVADTILQQHQHALICFFDDDYPAKHINGIWDVVGTTKDLLNNASNYDCAIIAIGNNSIRRHKQQQCIDAGVNITSFIHPRASVSPLADIGRGVVILAGAVVNAFAVVGDACIINSNSVVEHDVKLSIAVHVCPGTNIAGGVEIGAETWVGIGATVKQLVKIGSKVTIGAGATVIKDVTDNLTIVGSPAKPLMR